MKYKVAAGFCLLASLAWLLPEREKQEKPMPSQGNAGTYFTTCAACHGDHGQGNNELGAPSIASLPRWYVEEQVQKFRTGLRGKHPGDESGQRMRGAVLNLSDAQVAEAIDTLEAFPVISHKPTMEGDLKRGAVLYRDHCMECHRFNGRGEIAFRSSPVVGLQDWYLLAQCEKFKLGIRGYHTDDEDGAKMRKAIHYLQNDSEVLDVIAYITTLSEQYPENDKPTTSKP